MRDPAKRIRRRKNRVLVTVEEIEHGPPTRRVSERTVNKDNRRFGHETSFTAEGDGGLCRTSGGLRFGGAVTAWTSRGHSADGAVKSLLRRVRPRFATAARTAMPAEAYQAWRNTCS